MWFDFARNERFPSQFEANKTPVTVDVLEVGLIFSFVILAVTFYIVFLGLRGKRLGAAFLRTTTSLILGAIVIVGNFGQEWEIGHIKTKTPYRIGTGVEINADIGVKIGFRSVNVTLKADSPVRTVLEGERIDYNERFDWTWDQGRFGFGPYAGHLQRSFREAQYKGLPLPILWVVDYFVFDGEGLRFGRFYRTAGWYAHICMWVAFATWILSNILFQSVIRYGVNFLAVTGLVQLTACLIWGVVRNSHELDIPFDNGSLTMSFGSSFYLTLIGGIACCAISLIIFVCNLLWPEETADFFGIDPLSDFDEYHLTAAEASQLRKKNSSNRNVVELDDLDEHSHEKFEQPEYDDVVIFKRRTSASHFGIKRNTIRNIRHLDEEHQPIYSNVAQPLQTVREDVPIMNPFPSSSNFGRPIRQAPVLPPKRRQN